MSALRILIKQVEDPLYREIFEALVGEIEEARRFDQRLSRLEELVEKILQAQERMQRELEALKESQERMQRELEALKEAQEKHLEEWREFRKKDAEEKKEIWRAIQNLTQAVEKLTGEHRKTREQLGGLAHAVGYILEDRAFVGLPPLLEKEGLQVEEPLRREYVEITPERWMEVNIYGVARRNGKKVYIIGEAKTQLKKRDVDQFLKHVKALDRWLPGEKFLLLVTYQTSPQVRKYVKEKGIHLYFSYQFPLIS